MKNRISDLNDHLFAQIERLADESKTPDEVELECKRGNAIVAVADQILRRTALQVQAAKIVADHAGNDPRPYLPQLGGPSGTAAPMIEGRKQ